MVFLRWSSEKHITSNFRCQLSIILSFKHSLKKAAWVTPSGNFREPEKEWKNEKLNLCLNTLFLTVTFCLLVRLKLTTSVCPHLVLLTIPLYNWYILTEFYQLLLSQQVNSWTLLVTDFYRFELPDHDHFSPSTKCFAVLNKQPSCSQFPRSYLHDVMLLRDMI